MGGPPRKKARAPQKKRPAAPPGIGPQPKKKEPQPDLAAAAPTQEGLRGEVTNQELEPYVGLRASYPCFREGSAIKVGSDCSGVEYVVT
eukprot:7796955-Lingulodinium_polyedra.AAC.1